MRNVCMGAIALSLALASATVSAAEADLVKYRMNNMGVIGSHMGSISAIVKGEVPYQDQLPMHAQGMAAAATHVKAVFKDKAMNSKSEAKPEIWTDWNEFAKRADTFKQAADKLAEVADSGNQGAIRAAVGEVGKTCKGCHDNFKQD